MDTARVRQLHELVRLSRSLGDPAADMAMGAEGNTSALDGECFWIKASGMSLQVIDERGFVQVGLAPCLQALDGQSLSDVEVREFLSCVRADAKGDELPSVETFMHAYLLSLPGIEFVGHCHPTALLSLLCTDGVESYCERRLFPDEIVLCGPATAFVDYVDPGLELARAIRRSVERFITRWDQPPKTIWLRNHGLIALGKTASEVENACLMSVKVARVWLGILSTGRQPVCLTSQDIDRIYTRPDEHYRQRLLWQGKRT